MKDASFCREEEKKTEKEDTTPVPVRIAKMTVDERLEYFNFLFDTNEKQIELKCDQIIVNKKSIAKVNDGAVDRESLCEDLDLEGQKEDNDDDSEDLSIYLSLDTIDENANIPDCLYPKVNQKDGFQDACDGREYYNIRAECIICFDHFKAGDIIVHSETYCRHVYHKACMVTYLANQRRSKRQLKEETPPLCPTCRRPFCTLIVPNSERSSSPDDIDSKANTVDPVSANSSMMSFRSDDDIERGVEN